MGPASPKEGQSLMLTVKRHDSLGTTNPMLVCTARFVMGSLELRPKYGHLEG
jgi:hypothetical protein